MTIKNIIPADVTGKTNKLDIVIGMNPHLAEASLLSRWVLAKMTLTRPLDLGDVITCDFDGKRRLHLIICHHLGRGGWMNAEKYVRWGFDYLWQRSALSGQEFAAVQIGTGAVGRRDGADTGLIRTAMADSFAPIHLYVWDDTEAVAAANVVAIPLRPIRMWNMHHGEKRIPMVA